MTLPGEVIKLNFPFDFIGRLTDIVPDACRSYDPITTIWTIQNEYYDKVKNLYEQTFGLPNYDLFEGTNNE
jgi:hypothetical protein